METVIGHVQSIGHSGGLGVTTSKCFLSHFQTWMTIFGSNVRAAQMPLSDGIETVKVIHQQCLKLAMIKVYKVDKVACLRHIAAKEGIVLSYRSRSEESRRATALKKREYRKKITPDKESDYGPPDRIDNFVPAGATACNLKKG